MSDDEVTGVSLRRLAEKHFGFLLARGFGFVEAGCSDGPVLTVVTIAGKNVALRVSYDRRERACGIRVAKLEGDPADLYGVDLGVYLRSHCGYRGGYSDGMTLAQLKALSPQGRLERSLRWFAGIIQAHAQRIVDDSEDFRGGD